MSQRIRQRLDQLAEEIRAIDDRKERLGAFLENISSRHRGVFDDEERAAVETALSALVAARDEKAASLRAKIELYEKQAVGLEQRIEARGQVMQDCEQQLHGFDDIVQLIAQKQADLTREFARAQAELDS